MRYYLGVAKDRGVSEGVIREAMAAAVATNGGRPRAQAREALRGLLDPLPVQTIEKGCCHD
jgi:alkylhydroperoxidase/carboxymuconolactone decarboxylase family protein YurZ